MGTLMFVFSIKKSPKNLKQDIYKMAIIFPRAATPA